MQDLWVKMTSILTREPQPITHTLQKNNKTWPKFSSQTTPSTHNTLGICQLACAGPVQGLVPEGRQQQRHMEAGGTRGSGCSLLPRSSSRSLRSPYLCSESHRSSSQNAARHKTPPCSASGHPAKDLVWQLLESSNREEAPRCNLLCPWSGL
jgi:hypothetical protein